MPDIWSAWEQSVTGRGKPERLAQDLSDEELVNLLATCNLTDPTSRVLKQEALMRLHRAPRADRGRHREDGARARGRVL